MKVLILAGGYGTRLEKDLKNDESGKYRHLIGVPKPLLPIGNESLITRWMKILQHVSVIDDVYVVTNGANHEMFEEWSRDWPNVRLVSDGSLTNEDRTGAVGCMNLSVRHFKITEDLLVIAGDTLFYEDFDLQQSINKFEEFKQKEQQSNMLVYINCPDDVVHKHGILETDESQKVVGFREKPQPTETPSRKQCPCFYFLNKDSLSLLEQFLQESKGKPMQAWDATGNFVAYLFPRKPVYAVEISGRFDVGGLDSYLQCHEYFLKAKS